MEKIKSFLKNKKTKIIAIVVVSLLLIGGGVYYFLLKPERNDYSHTLIPVKKSDKGDWGFVNLEGELVIDFDLDLNEEEDSTLGYMYDGIAYYTDSKSNTITYVDNKLKEKKTNYVKTLYFHDGLALVVEDFGKLKYINKDFEEKLTLDYKEAGYFSEGYAKFKNEDDKWGFINKEGHVIIDAEYHSVTPFINGYAIVTHLEEDERRDREKEWGVIDTDGNEVIELSDKYGHIFHNDKKSFGFFTYDDDRRRIDECGFINLEEEEFIEEDWQSLTPFINGYASFYEYDEDRDERYDERRSSREEGEWGLIDSDGEEIIKSKENNPIIIHNGLYIFEDDGEYGFKNIKKEKIIKAKYKEALPFLGDGAFVKKGNGWDYIDKEGEKIKNKDHNIKELRFESGKESLEYNLFMYNTPFSLDQTLKSLDLNINNMLSSVFPTISYDIFGVEKNSDAMDVIEYMKDQSHLLEKKSLDNISKDSLFNTLRVYRSDMSSNRLCDYNKFVIDDNFAYEITYYFNNNVVEYQTSGSWNCSSHINRNWTCSELINSYGDDYHKRNYYRETTNYSKPYQKNDNASLSRISTTLYLSGTAQGMNEKISEKISNYLLKNDYNDNNNSYTKNNHSITIDENHTSISINVTFNQDDKEDYDDNPF